MKRDIALYEQLLSKERVAVLSELHEAGANVDEEGRQHWEAKTSDVDTLRSDTSDVAERLETYGENAALIRRLSLRFSEVNAALTKIKLNNGSFGLCRVCDKEIENDRLAANPAATTCKQHMRS